MVLEQNKTNQKEPMSKCCVCKGRPFFLRLAEPAMQISTRACTVKRGVCQYAISQPMEPQDAVVGDANVNTV